MMRLGLVVLAVGLVCCAEPPTPPRPGTGERTLPLLRTDASWTAESDQVDGMFGMAVASAGDVDGDGFGDVIVGAPGYDAALEDEGRVFLFRGSAGGLEAVPSWTADSGQGPGDIGNVRFGAVLAGAGDVDADGYDDVLVSAYDYTTAIDGAGRVLLYRGSPDGLEAAPSWTFEGDAEWIELGWSLAGAGDVNGDGYDDVLVSARNYGLNYAGRVYLFYGAPDGLPAVPSWSVESNVESAHFGQSVAGADVNGDDYADVIVVDEIGGIYAYHGSNAVPERAASWSAALGGPGLSVSSAGDVNGDGHDDVVVGSGPGASVYLGSEAGLGDAPAWTASPGFGINFGFSVSGAGDVDFDGYADIVIGEYDYGIDDLFEGRAFVFQGSAAGVEEEASWITESNQDGAQFGWSVAGAGDVDADGFDDVIVGAPYFGNDQLAEGRAFLYRGAVNDGVPCDGGLWRSSECDDSHCWLDEVWYLNGESNPANPCETCVVATSQVAWTAAADLTACDGGLCRAGVCEASCFIDGDWVADGEADPADACGICAAAIDARAYTAAADGTECGDGLCRDGRCDAAECFIDGSWVVNAAADAGNACHVCDVAADRAAWSDADEGTECEEGLCHDGECQADRCYIGGVWYVDGAANPENACEECDPTTDGPREWSSLDDCGGGGGDDDGGCSCSLAGGRRRGSALVLVLAILAVLALRRRA